jgi:hypothetical protein
MVTIELAHSLDPAAPQEYFDQFCGFTSAVLPE